MRLSKKKKEENLSVDAYYVRPFLSDEKFLQKKMRESGDKEGVVLREIIKAGVYHLRLTEARQDPTHTYAKAKTVEALQEGLQPTKSQLDIIQTDLDTVLTRLETIQNAAAQNDRKLQAVAATVNEKHDSLMKILIEIFRNIMSIRGLYYIFILAWRMTPISDKRNLDQNGWISFVNQTVKITADTSAESVANEDWQTIENKFIPSLANKIYKLINPDK